MDDDKKCAECALDRVTITNVIECIARSVFDVIQDILNGNASIETFTKNDRILYIIGLLIVGLSIRLLVTA